METPCLLPVVHPISTEIPPSELSSLGFNAIMTNSFIINRRRKAEALEKGIHRMLGFEGLIMTDSGGYQVLEYGAVDVGELGIAAFQSAIGSDMAVTLDRPTGLTQSKRYAAETVKVSLRNAKRTIRELRESQTTWMGPIQGGIFHDLVSRCTRELVSAGFRVLALGSPVEIMENYLFADLVRMIVATKKAMPYSIPLHLFGAGHPLVLSLAVALGCDTFDSASYVLFAKQNRYMTERGTADLDQLAYLPCSCPICNSTTPAGLSGMERRERVRKLSLHNLHVLQAEVRRCKQAIVEGRLWDLVEERATSHPSMKTAFRELTNHSELLAASTPLLKRSGLFVRSLEDFDRPELRNARRHVEGVFRRGAKTAALVQSDESKPLNRMGVIAELKASKKKEGGLDVHRLHPALGQFPAELEYVYPYTHVVSSMDGHERHDLRKSLATLKSMGYSCVLVCDESSIRRSITFSRAVSVKR